jgi:Flp pilus assembly pilin Flp
MRASTARRTRREQIGVQPPATDCRGVTTLEYGLVAGLIALVCITAINSIGPGIGSIFGDVVSSLPFDHSGS